MTDSPAQPPTANLQAATWRLLISPFADGPTNMAVDEAILLAIAEGHAPPTLRFFGWEPPCLSLGYAQPLADVDQARLRRLGWDLVRRPTGGRAILHTDELTYSVIAPGAEPRVLGGVVESYRQLSAGLLRGLHILGLSVRADKQPAGPGGGQSAATLLQPASPQARSPNANPVCFEVPSSYEITAGGRKLIGSAQVRKRGVVLQHGTLPLSGDVARIVEALVFETDEGRQRARARIHERAATVAEVCGRKVDWAEAVEAMTQGFGEALNLRWHAGSLTALEQAQAARLRAEKYAAAAWSQRA